MLISVELATATYFTRESNVQRWLAIAGHLADTMILSQHQVY